MENKTSDKSVQRAAAILALGIDEIGAPPAPGPRPSIQEIIAWHRQQLAEPRASEVGAHVARDPDCHSVWVELLEEDGLVPARDAKPEKAAAATVAAAASGATPVAESGWLDRLRDWLAPGFSVPLAGVGAGAVALLVAAITMQAMLPSLDKRLAHDTASLWDAPVSFDAWPPSSDFGSKSPGDEWVDPSSRAMTVAFAYGVREQLLSRFGESDQWKTVLEALPTGLPECGKDDAKCASLLPLVQQAGGWTAAVALRCHLDAGDAARLSGGNERLGELVAALEGYPPAADLMLGYQQWQQAEPGAFCAEATAMLVNVIR